MLRWVRVAPWVSGGAAGELNVDGVVGIELSRWCLTGRKRWRRQAGKQRRSYAYPAL